MDPREANDSRIVNETEKIRNWASHRIDPNMLDDFVQDTAMRWFDGRSVDTPYQHLLADYYRRHGRRARQNKDPTDALRNPVYGFKFANLKSEDKEERREDPRITKLIKSLTQQQRTIIVLKFSWDFTNREIAHVMGVTESRISMILKEIRLKK